MLVKGFGSIFYFFFFSNVDFLCSCFSLRWMCYCLGSCGWWGFRCQKLSFLLLSSLHFVHLTSILLLFIHTYSYNCSQESVGKPHKTTTTYTITLVPIPNNLLHPHHYQPPPSPLLPSIILPRHPQYHWTLSFPLKFFIKSRSNVLFFPSSGTLYTLL